ncbi:hypothetical protein Goshw_010968, partial [Gossypium schwendimanii]|nr:hypothetical protein [Gossypium schwendimanii]
TENFVKYVCQAYKGHHKPAACKAQSSSHSSTIHASFAETHPPGTPVIDFYKLALQLPPSAAWHFNCLLQLSALKVEAMHQSPHVLIFPFPAQGHVNSMLKLAELWALASLKVTFLNSKYNHECLVCHIYILSHFTQYPGFKFETIPDRLPQDHPLVVHAIGDMFESLELITHLRNFCQGQLTEFWFGLVNTGKRFLWVLRPKIVPENDRGHDDVPAELVEDSVIGKDGEGEDVVKELSKKSKARGYIVDWAPQEAVLNHLAIGRFLTHSGWNSTLENMLPGKIVEKMVNDVMVDRKEEFAISASEMAKVTNRSVRPMDLLIVISIV